MALGAGLQEPADEWLSLPTDKGANAALKVASLVAGMVAGADSIDDMALLRDPGMCRLFPNNMRRAGRWFPWGRWPASPRTRPTLMVIS